MNKNSATSQDVTGGKRVTYITGESAAFPSEPCSLQVKSKTALPETTTATKATSNNGRNRGTRGRLPTHPSSSAHEPKTSHSAPPINERRKASAFGKTIPQPTTLNRNQEEGQPHRGGAARGVLNFWAQTIEPDFPNQRNTIRMMHGSVFAF